MVVWIAGAHGRLGSRVVALLLARGSHVRCVVREEGQAAALRELGAEAVVADLRGDIEWTADGCDAGIFAAGARHRGELGAVDAGGAAKAAEAADRYDFGRFVLCSALGAGHPERHGDGVRAFLAAKHHAERRLAHLDMPWSILRFGALTEHAGSGRIATAHRPGVPARLSRDDAALTVVESLGREHLSRQIVPIVDGDRAVAAALDSVPPRPLPRAPAAPAGSLGAAQSDNPRHAADMLFADAAPLDASVEWEGDGPVPPELVGNEDPSPGVP